MFPGKGAQRWSTYLIARKRLEMTKNVFQIKFRNYFKKIKSLVQRKTNHEKEETDKIRANKMIRVAQ